MQQPGILSTSVSYTGGHLESPTYTAACRGDTGHAEAVILEFDTSIINYDRLLDLFWTCHDPSQLNRQGPDIGSQYRSAIFTTTDDQLTQANASAIEQAHVIKPKQLATIITPLEIFYPAEEYHQQYFIKHPNAACHIHLPTTNRSKPE